MQIVVDLDIFSGFYALVSPGRTYRQSQSIRRTTSLEMTPSGVGGNSPQMQWGKTSHFSAQSSSAGAIDHAEGLLSLFSHPRSKAECSTDLAARLLTS